MSTRTHLPVEALQPARPSAHGMGEANHWLRRMAPPRRQTTVYAGWTAPQRADAELRRYVHEQRARRQAPYASRVPVGTATSTSTAADPDRPASPATAAPVELERVWPGSLPLSDREIPRDPSRLIDHWLRHAQRLPRGTEIHITEGGST